LNLGYNVIFIAWYIQTSDITYYNNNSE
jgi:hypothetical protein